MVYQGSWSWDKFNVISIQNQLILNFLWTDNSDTVKHINFPHLIQYQQTSQSLTGLHLIYINKCKSQECKHSEGYLDVHQAEIWDNYVMRTTAFKLLNTNTKHSNTVRTVKIYIERSALHSLILKEESSKIYQSI